LQNPLRVVCLVNSVNASNIPLENFVAVNSQDIEKHLVVFRQSKKEAEAFMNTAYPNVNLQVHSCAGAAPYKRGSILLLKRLLQGLQPDVVHAHHTGVALAAAMLRPYLRFQLLITAHHTFTDFGYRQKVGWSLAFVMADRIVCNSGNTLKSLPFFIKPLKTKIIYNGVNFQELDQTYPSQGETRHGLRIGTVCRMVPQKDLTTLIRAFADIAATPNLEDVELRLVGDGPEKVCLESMVSQLGLDRRVQFTGALSRKDAYQELVDLDIFVVSSRWEGFCNAMVEGAATGKAVVATNIDPLPEVIGSENALFFNVGDDKGLARQLKRLCENRELREALGHKVQGFVRSRYPLEQSAQAYENVYRTLTAFGCVST